MSVVDVVETFLNSVSYDGLIGLVNEAFMSRLLSISKGDASPNALVILGAFTEMVTFSAKGQMLSDLELMFKTYLE